jgi:hypothetical protein
MIEAGSRRSVITITPYLANACDPLGSLRGAPKRSPSLVNAIYKLAQAGEHAGLSLEQMIELLDGGVSVETLLEMIASRLDIQNAPAVPTVASCRWIV